MTEAAKGQHPFAALTPDFIMDAVEACGLRCDARILELNSYENRVYQVGLEDAEPVVAKFYRPERWNKAQLLEEHEFTLALAENELSCVPPMLIDGQSLHHYQGFDIALFERRGGRAPPIEDMACLTVLGRFIARIHNEGARDSFKARPSLSAASYGHASRQWLLESDFVPADLRDAYASTTEGLLGLIDAGFAAVAPMNLRIHADCHLGNLLWRDDAPHFVDFDDARTGPAIQDLWMLLSGDNESKGMQMKSILKGYEDFRDLNLAELRLIEPLRTLRMMHHAAWLARRWEDPAFPRAFPFFNTERYWAQHVLELREQWAAIEEPPLQIYV